MQDGEPLRPFTTEEFELLQWMVEHGSEDLRTFAPQIEGILAARWCDCGCPSIRLEVAEGAPLGKDIGQRVIGDFEGETAKGGTVGVILFQRGGKLELLEVYSIDARLPRNNSSEWGLPTIASMALLVWEPSPRNPNIRIPVRSPKSPA